MKHRSPTNSRIHENLELYHDYIAAQNGLCELHKNFPDIFPHKNGGMWKGKPYAHHIFHVGRRWDLESNLIVVSNSAHMWVHANPIEGTLYCMLAKIRKGEADVDEWARAFGKRVEGWMTFDKVIHANVSVEHDREICEYLGVEL